jgi:hypothetical protein
MDIYLLRYPRNFICLDGRSHDYLGEDMAPEVQGTIRTLPGGDSLQYTLRSRKRYRRADMILRFPVMRSGIPYAPLVPVSLRSLSRSHALDIYLWIILLPFTHPSQAI